MNHVPILDRPCLIDSDVRPYFLSHERIERLVGTARSVEDQLKGYYDAARRSSFCHDEPWLTLMALYGLFGNQSDLNRPERLRAVNALLSKVYSGRVGNAEPPVFKELAGAYVEVRLPENRPYQNHLKCLFQDGAYHPYADRRQTLITKLGSGNASLEGNTNVDAVMTGKGTNDREVCVIIEAKFLSDISTCISYVPVRNQIARNVDCAIDFATRGGKDPNGLDEIWFALLTPGLFRIPEYGIAPSTPLDTYQPSKGRFYCYKMRDYLDAGLLQQDLPHWDGKLSSVHWQKVSNRIGWITFEEMADTALSAGLLPSGFEQDFREFFKERGMYVRD